MPATRRIDDNLDCIVIEKYKKLKNNEGHKIRGSLRESPGIEAWYAKREALCRKKGDGNTRE